MGTYFWLLSVAEASLFIFHLLFVLEKNPPRWRKIVIKLAIPDTPEEGHQEATGDKDADEKKKDDCTHFM